MDNEIVKLIFERKMSDAKDLIDQALNTKLAGALVEKLGDDVNEKLDPVGKEDDDIDNDGDSDESDDYLRKRRKAIGKAMNTRKGMNEKKKEEEENVKRLDSRGLGVKRQSGLGKKLKNESVNEGAPDTELDHHKGKNPNIFDQDYLPMKNGGKTYKAKGSRTSGGY